MTTATFTSLLFRDPDDRTDNSPVPQGVSECGPEAKPQDLKNETFPVQLPSAPKPSVPPVPEKPAKTPKSPVPAAANQSAVRKPERSPGNPSENSAENLVAYEVREGDSLWKIIKKQYGLSDKPEDARQVGNILELIRSNEKNAGLIRGPECVIFAKDTIFLPKEGSFSYG